MENRRRVQGGGDQWNEVSRRKSQSKRPPRGPQGSWQQTVPSWEKSFCKIVGLLDWETVLEMKKFAFLFDNVVKWDSSASEEAFQNAKNRFWAQLHGIPCDISLPDPNLYIDEIDWDCKVDSDMLLDLDCKPVEPGQDEKHDTVIIFGDALIPSDAFSTPGWGEEENLRKANSSLNNHEDQWEHGWKNNETMKQSGWSNGEWGLEEDGRAVACPGWGGDWNNSGDWNCDYHHKEESQNLEDGGVTTGETGRGSDWNNSGDWNCDYLHKEESRNLEDSGVITGETGWESDWNNSGYWNYDYQKEIFENSKGRKWHSEKGGVPGDNRCPGDWDNTRDWNYNHQKENYTNLKGGNVHYNSFPGMRDASYRRRGNGGRYMPKYKNSKFPSDDHHRNAARGGKLFHGRNQFQV